MFKLNVFCYSLLFTTLFMNTPLMAQDADDAEEVTMLEEVIVTGSRIRRNPPMNRHRL